MQIFDSMKKNNHYVPAKYPYALALNYLHDLPCMEVTLYFMDIEYRHEIESTEKAFFS